MQRGLFAEVMIDIQTVVIVILLYAFFREEQANAFLRTWLLDNFPLGLSLLDPLTVAGISGTLIAVTVFRVVFFVTGRNVILERVGSLRNLNKRKRFQELVWTNGTGFLALALTVFGVSLTLYSYLISGNTPLAALGISCVILGFTAVSLPRHSGGGLGMRAILQGAVRSVEEILEGHMVQRATYLPPVYDGLVSAYVPLSPETEILSQIEMRKAPTRLVGNLQKGLLLYPLGSELSRIPEFQNGLSLEERLRYVLVESANICSQVITEETGNRIMVGLKGADLNIQGQRYLASLGSLPSSLAACVIAALHNRPVTLLEERKTSDRLTAVFRLLA